MRVTISTYRWLRLLCILCLLPSIAQADVLQVIYPPDGSELATGMDHEIRVRWTDESEPVIGSEIQVEASFGTLSASTITTLPNGVAIVTINSDTTGESTFRANVPTVGIEDQISVEFVNPSGPVNPYGDLVLIEDPGSGMELFVFRDRVGFLAQPGIDADDVAALAQQLGLLQLPPLANNIFVLQFAVPRPRQVLREAMAAWAVDHKNIVRKAGLVAKVKSVDQWLVVPDEIMIRFQSGLNDGDIAAVLANYDDPLGKSPVNSLRMLIPLRLSDSDVFVELNELATSNAPLMYAEPNYVIALDQRSPVDEPGFEWQWTLESNDSFGLNDADVDASGAWDYTTGSSDTIVAVIDRGFYIEHPDLKDNLWPLDSDTDKGIDLIDNNASDLSSSITDYEPYAHGTSAAGVIGAIGDNNEGDTGICPDCQLLLMRKESNYFVIVTAMELALDNHADVISNSWGFKGSYPAFEISIDEAVAGFVVPGDTEHHGAVVFFAMSNGEKNDCVEQDISSYEKVIGVSGVSDYDRRAASSGQAKGYGSCMDIVAPTAGGDQGVLTTSVEYDMGPVATYRSDFSGTSAAAPLAAGVAALVDSLDNKLSPIKMQYILQDTADRVAHYDWTRPGESADYDPESGFSDPDGTPRYGYGRVNALEAVRLVAARDIVSDRYGPGRSGRDLLLRDHILDWGNTEQPANTVFEEPRWAIDYYKSVDMKLDVEPFQANPITAAEFAALSAEEPEIGKPMRVHVRLRNRGPYTIESVNLKLLKAVVGDDYPELPTDFWTAFPGTHTAASEWQSSGDATLLGVAYSGASLAGCPGRTVPPCLPSLAVLTDAAQIATFNIDAMDWNPAIHKGPAFLAVASAFEDPAAGVRDPANASLDVVDNVNHDNNVTLWTPGTIPDWQIPPPPLETCSDDLKDLITALLVIAVLALIAIIVLLLTGNTVPSWLWSLLVLVLLALLYFYSTNPDCVYEVIHHWLH